ncbi:hypothetical protein AMELA_G00234250 [Ameiurus melas]|uniref:Uncharacterized protein n=1 Tax=Ameiurus melas TaxID=219545 RepID=A0A7J5ZY59_AMEME|nr:hypothetical protein AMELA_G00234250 [Ameiurus melas]
MKLLIQCRAVTVGEDRHQAQRCIRISACCSASCSSCPGSWSCGDASSYEILSRINKVCFLPAADCHIDQIRNWTSRLGGCRDTLFLGHLAVLLDSFFRDILQGH